MSARRLVAESVVITLPDTTYGLAIDENGQRAEGVSCSAQDRAKRVQMITEDENDDIAIARLTPAECVELGRWLVSAGVRFGARP